MTYSQSAGHIATYEQQRKRIIDAYHSGDYKPLMLTAFKTWPNYELSQELESCFDIIIPNITNIGVINNTLRLDASAKNQTLYIRAEIDEALINGIKAQGDKCDSFEIFPLTKFVYITDCNNECEIKIPTGIYDIWEGVNKRFLLKVAEI